ncbi:LPXTG-motif protein cell wall anchor domain protein [Enterococcus faecium R496]|uniref:LPXTG-motif protein cell wall anchor domain protein n=2 Tax=Enterococcus TaxID=1350 RepID=A0AAV3GSH5_ENTFC|nr:LPXTG-motif protein cell wall anchor domain protein [Enterococcus faecium R501]EJX48790.1 LPXTG-motif protein cell wall anchor domain protein [Enterococcus faecium R496]EJX61256.1 LPXTG-motif protein cell wall anchor domain protein [Enterococcus faecium P1986]EJX73724.1 LPXTG-motif protein cell wall anchor domain protein [Enterococcus faecium P1137]EJX76449.1 LPXTG-motif protein cell wall anchor domain protein [Enterococcus faecium P1139]EJX80416.1 LPXTG-motif protein cell wall anchor domai
MIEMKKTATVLFVILGLSIIAAMIGISTSANERANENLSFTVKTDRIVYDMTQQVITIPVKPNKSVNASDVHAVLTYGWDGNGSSEKVIGEVYLKDVQWTAGIEYTIMISAELSIDEIKSKDKVDLIVFYDGQMTITENLKPSSWTVVGPPSSTDSTSSESSTENTSGESSTESTSSESSTENTSSESSTESTSSESSTGSMSSESSTGSTSSESSTGKVNNELDLVPIIPTKEQKRNAGSNLKSVLKQPDFVSRGIDHQEKAKETDNRKSDLPETGSRTLNKLITWMGVLLILIVGASYFRSLFHRVK